MPGTLLFTAAHPDDDAYGCAGTVALHAGDPRFRFVLVHATDGEAGQIAHGSGATRERLGPIRREEDRRAWQTLGREPDRHDWLGFPDGGLADLPDGLLVDRLSSIFAQERPDVVYSVGPDGITGHPDHIELGRAATEAFMRFADDGGRGFRRLVYGVIRASVLERWNAGLVAQGLPPWDPTQVYHPRGVPDDAVDVTVDTSSVAARKHAAVLQHRTQWDDLNPQYLTERQALNNASRETMVVAWPPDRPGRMLTDVFEDL